MSESGLSCCLAASLLVAACASGPSPVGDFSELNTRTATLASLRPGRPTGQGDYLMSTHPVNTSGLLVNEELRIAPGGPILELVIRAQVQVTDRGGGAPVGFEVVRPDMDKILLRFEPPGGAGQRTLVVDGTGARELIVRPSAMSRDLVLIRGSSQVTWVVEVADSTARKPS